MVKHRLRNVKQIFDHWTVFIFKVKWILLILFFFIFIASLYAKKSPQQKLTDHLNLWQKFRWQGIAEVNYKSYALRKYFVLAHDSTAWRLDILDSGILGLTNKPLAVIHLQDSISIYAPTIRQMQGMNPNWFVSEDMVKTIIHFTDSLAVRSEEIISKKQTSLNGIKFTFDKKLRLSSLVFEPAMIFAKITYNRHNHPKTVTMNVMNKGKIIFSIDERDYSNFTIEAIPSDEFINQEHR